jgi:hypothetical protein
MRASPDARLRPAGEVDDREPGVAQRDRLIDEHAAAVRPAMGQGAVHRRQDAPRLGSRRGKPG